MSRQTRVAAFVLAAAVLQACAPQRPRPLPPEKDARPSAAFGVPLPGFSVLSKFGPRGRRYHTGIDIRARRGGGDSVLASRGGRVIRAQTMSGYGRMVEIRHEDGFSTRYAHLRRMTVRKGATVAKGEVIGTVGATGRATTAHLHFEILTPGYRFLDPWPFIKAGNN